MLRFRSSDRLEASKTGQPYAGGMANSTAEATEEESEPSRAKISWEPSEIVAATILAAVVLIVVGALASALAATVGIPSSLAGIQDTAAEIEIGAAWSGPVFSLFFLATLALCWWQLSKWGDVAVSDPDEELPDVEAHLWRTIRMLQWTQVGFGINAAAAVAGFVGVLMQVTSGPSSPFIWARAIGDGGATLGTIAIACGGLWTGLRLRAQRQLA